MVKPGGKFEKLEPTCEADAQGQSKAQTKTSRTSMVLIVVVGIIQVATWPWLINSNPFFKHVWDNIWHDTSVWIQSMKPKPAPAVESQPYQGRVSWPPPSDLYWRLQAESERQARHDELMRQQQQNHEEVLRKLRDIEDEARARELLRFGR